MFDFRPPASRPEKIDAGGRSAAPLALLRSLEWRMRHAVENVISGEYRSAFRGRGMEFDQVVRYEYGDDVRDIDWNVTARLGEPYRKKYVEEREVTLLLMFEDSLSLQFGSTGKTKREALLELAGLLALLGAINRDRVAVLYSGNGKVLFRPPVRGRGPIHHSAAALLAQPAPDLTAAPAGEDALSALPWKFLSRAMPRHSVLLWLGDFPPRAAPEGWAVLERRYETLGLRIDDPWERELPPTGPLTAYDPLAGRLLPLNPRSRWERRAHVEWGRRRDAAFQQLFPNPMNRLVASTEQPMLDVLVSFFHARMRARGS